MSVFGSIMGAIFGHGSAQAKTPPTATATATATTAAPAASPAASTAPDAPDASVPQTVDVAAIVEKAAAATGERLDWRSSIVDLMKALGLDSSLTARKELAKELNYTGDTNNTAAMNVWLHQQVMAKLAANGGKLPSDIKV
ncbi:MULTISPECIES: DUF3597 domain-containing protein [unclassified Bradyrhizobium]|uniref:DUF3597 domain-containing protein n=1 Tax=unclassified Bradyrhizobium TaxID=2631580 RepID=UPI00247ADDD9|nr:MULTISPECIES: DUF3597 domain-containing protein [unclassified Bradyrhizobium]WGS20421.1 DUF3597 domain-containing protein [Bradyrhizobium sp. ISRA463]WGS27301.1 DUF3597 domain-containing protein [Bradyrhizobium sp. ISRA464]